MFKEFTNSTRHIHAQRLRDWTETAGERSANAGPRATLRLRRALGHVLISLGERIARLPARGERHPDPAA